MNYPAPNPQPPLQPAKKKGSGCLLAVMLAGGVLLVIALVVGFFAYRFAQSPEGQRAVSLVGEGAKLATEATTAPGTKELRALGCSNATVVDAVRMAAFTQRASGDAAPAASLPYRLLVTCQTSKSATTPTCDQVASAYRVAVGTPAGPYEAVVVRGNEAGCSALYGVDGLKIHDSKTE